MSTTPDVQPPDATYVRARWVPAHVVDWVNDCDKIMREHGAVEGAQAYEKRYQARWRAQRLIRLMVQLDLHQRWQLFEHTSRKPAGWTWSVEYRKEQPNGR